MKKTLTLLVASTALTAAIGVPASSANRGPGYDTFAAALAFHLDVEVEETGTGLKLSLPHIRLDRALQFLFGDRLA